MTMQLFSFGHPCEHQLRRTCIGGSSCPLNGFPDSWCCSFIKGKINFKRDKPCEGPRCRWGFTHPSQAQFDAVTQVLNESRLIAAKIDESEDHELLSFQIENPHIVDTVQCTLHMMRHPPSSCARRVGQLLACATFKTGDAKVFMQLLKTMKKPVDGYLLGAYAYLTQSNSPTPCLSQPQLQQPHSTSKGKVRNNNINKEKKEDVSDELKNSLVDLMNAALSQGGHLVDRDDQHILQATFILALRQYPKSNKKRQDMLEAALSKFGNRQLQKESPPGSALVPAATATHDASATSGVAINVAIDNGERSFNSTTTGATAPSPACASAASGVSTSAVAPAPAQRLHGGEETVSPSASNITHKQQTPAGGVKGSRSSTGNGDSHTTSSRSPLNTASVPPNLNTPKRQPRMSFMGDTKSSGSTTPATGAAPSGGGGPQSLTLPLTASLAIGSPKLSPLATPTASVIASFTGGGPPPIPLPTSTSKVPIVGISQVVTTAPGGGNAPAALPLRYSPIRTDMPLPDVLILGGMFNLSVLPKVLAPLGVASSAAKTLATYVTSGGGDGGVGPIPLNHTPNVAAQPLQSAASDAIMSAQSIRVTALPTAVSPHVNANFTYPDSIFGNLLTEPVFDHFDTAEIFKEFDEGWGN